MNILAVNNSSDLYGASRCMQRVLTRLAARGHRVFVVLPTYGPLVPLLREAGITVLFHPGLVVIDRQSMRSPIGMLSMVLRFPLSAVWLAFTLVRHRIDIVHTNTAMMPTPALAALLARRPHVWHVREFFGEFGPLWNLYQPYICFLSTVVIVISAAVRNQFAGNRLHKVCTVYDGLEAEWAQRLAAGQVQAVRAGLGPQAKFLIGVVGRIKWVRKGQEVAVEALARLKDAHPEARLVIIGSTAEGNEEHLARLIELAEQRGVADRITFTGDLAISPAIYAALNITVVPSIQPEPFGCVVMESMAAGTAVVGSDCGGISEQIVDRESGLLFAPGSAVQLAEHLDRLLRDEQLRSRLGEGGRARFLAHFVIDATVDAMEKIFEDCCRGVYPGVEQSIA